MASFEGNVSIAGALSAGSMTISSNAVATAAIQDSAVTRAKCIQEALAVFPVPLGSLRVWDAFATVLPASSATDDLSLVGGTFATNSPSIQTLDSKAATTTQYARFLLPIPQNYDAAESLQLRLKCGMITTVAGTSATVDIQAYESGKDRTISADLCATSAQSINSLTYANKTFDITATDLIAGDVLDVRVTIAIVDAATGTAVIGCIGGIDLLCDVRG